MRDKLRRPRSRGPLAAPATASILLLTLTLALAVAVAGPAAAAARPAEPLEQIVLPALGFGYMVTSQGPFDAATPIAPSVDPAMASAARALSAPREAHDVTFERSWQDAGGTNQVRDLLVRCSTPASASGLLDDVRQRLDAEQIVGTGPVPSVPGAVRAAYLSSSAKGGVGQAVTMSAGVYVDLMSFFSGAADNLMPITPAAAAQLARVQYSAMAAAPGGQVPPPVKSGKSWSGVVWAVLAVAVLTGAVVTPMLLRRRVVPAKDARKALR